MSPKVLASFAFISVFVVLPFSAQLKFVVMSREVIAQRLQGYKGNDSQREATLKAMFEDSGCRGNNLTEQALNLDNDDGGSEWESNPPATG